MYVFWSDLLLQINCNARRERLNLVECFKWKNAGEINPLSRSSLGGDIDCEQSLFCSKIRGEERKGKRSHTRAVGQERASVIC